MDSPLTRLVNGESGLFEGSASDRVVLERYEREGRWSESLLDLLCGGVLRDGGTLLDCGANIGLVSVPVARRTGTHCLAFEPAPLNAACLRRNVERHAQGERIEVHELALSDAPGTLTLALSPDNSGDHRVHAAGATRDAGWTEAQVPSARLDDVVQRRELHGPVVLKLDTQGSEARILRGARETLQRVDVVVLEYWPLGLVRLGDQASALFDLLADFPFAALLHQDDARCELLPRQELQRSLAWIATDGSDAGFFDLWFAKRC